MGKLIMVVGNSGVGKTTVTKALCKQMPELTAAFEQHAERPFQPLFAADLQRYALANQIDYLLYRAQQEHDLRQNGAVGIIDGGLDLDFYGFTQLFQQKGYLSNNEFRLCQQQYLLLRQLLTPPNLILYLTASVDIIKKRYAQRGRKLEITQQVDLHQLDQLIATWVSTIKSCPVITVDASDALTSDLSQLIQQIKRHLA